MTLGSDDVAASTWPSSRVELLRVHHALGLSALVSARLIGGVSRNAVISKRRRLGLTGANPLQAAMRALGRASRAACGLSNAHAHRPRRHPLDGAGAAPGEPLPFMDWPPPPGARPKSLADREAGECAWPLGPAEASGDHRTRFCCAPVKRGRPYCPCHQLRARRDPVPPPLAPANRGARR
jgi:GcrA cell cycle regulator